MLFLHKDIKYLSNELRAAFDATCYLQPLLRKLINKNKFFSDKDLHDPIKFCTFAGFNYKYNYDHRNKSPYRKKINQP